MHNKKLSTTITTYLLLLLFPISMFAISLPKTDKLLQDLPVTQQQSTLLKTRLQKTDLAAQKTIKTITRIEKFSNILNKLNESLKISLKVMLVLEAMPELEPLVSDIRMVVRDIQKPLGKVADKIKKVAKKLKPVKKRLIQIDKGIKKAIKATKMIALIAAKQIPIITKTATCIKTLNNQSMQNRLKKSIEKYSRNTDKIISRLNKFMHTINKVIDNTKKKTDKLMHLEKKIRPLEKILDKIWSKAKVFDPIFKKIKKLLNKKIKIAYKVKVRIKTPFRVKVKYKKWYKVYKWKWSWKWKKKFRWSIKFKVKYFSFTIQQIMNKIDAGISAVNKLLAKAAHK